MLKAFLDELWQTRAQRKKLVIDVRFNLEGSRRSWFHKVADEERRYPYKLLDLHLEEPVIQRYVADKRLVEGLHSLLGARPLVCNSLLFEWGSQQDAHFDTFFMPSKTRNKMAASWIAIDPVSEVNGPLYYYPKSHLVEPFRFSDGGIAAITSELATDAAAHIEQIVSQYGLERKEFHPRAGDVLIWHAQLLHGGARILNEGVPRRSLVSHYWTELDFPSAEQKIDLGKGCLLLKRPHMFVIDDDLLREVDLFLERVSGPDEMRHAVPENFDPRSYLSRNQDVLAAGMDPWTHYVQHGAAEGRRW